MVDGAAPRIRPARSTSGVGYAPQEEQHDRSEPTSHGVPGPLCTRDLSGEVAGATGVLATGPSPRARAVGASGALRAPTPPHTVRVCGLPPF